MIGRKVVFEWGGSEIPGVREKSATLNGEPVNITSDEDDGWQKLDESGEAGENNVEISLSGVTKNDVLKADWFAGNRTRTATFQYPNGSAITGTFFLASYTEGLPYNDAATFEATFQSNGVVTYAAYS